VGNDPFAVLLADDLLDGEPPVLKQMVDLYAHYHSSVIGVQDVPREETSQYGIVDAKELEDGVYKINSMVEKPKPEDAPSTLGVVGRYILTPRIFSHLESVQAGAGGEIQLTDGIASLLKQEQVLAYKYSGTRYDCGSKIGYLKATVELALKHPEVKDDFRAYLSSLEL
jgi:UTP--glucose-1-phosphate uridylyltransferase